MTTEEHLLDRVHNLQTPMLFQTQLQDLLRELVINQAAMMEKITILEQESSSLRDQLNRNPILYGTEFV